MSSILVHPRVQTHEVVKLLLKKRSVPVQASSPNALADIACGNYSVMLVTDIVVASSRKDAIQQMLHERFEALRHRSSRAAIIVVMMVSSEDPPIDALHFINFFCGVECNVSTTLCWTPAEAAQFIESLARHSTVSVDYNYHGAKDGTDLSAAQSLINGLTQVPHITRADAVRLVHKHRCVADFLANTDASMETVPGFGAKKLQRLSAVLHAPLLSFNESVNDVLAIPPPRAEEPSQAPASSESDARRIMLESLQQLQQNEDQDE